MDVGDGVGREGKGCEFENFTSLRPDDASAVAFYTMSRKV
jgi:hypothetical protein